MKQHFLIIALVAAVALNPTAWAATQQYVISLEPEGGGGRTGGGSGTITFDDALNTLTFNDILWSGLSAPANNAHIHGPSAPFPATAGVLYDLVGPGHIALGDTAGTITGTLTLTDGAAGFDLADQLLQLENGEWYINIHSTAFPGGEIGQQIVASELRFFAFDRTRYRRAISSTNSPNLAMACSCSSMIPPSRCGNPSNAK